MSLYFTKDRKFAIDLNEVRLINGKSILFKNDPKVYDIGDEAADAVRELFTSRIREPQPTPRDTSKESQPSDRPLFTGRRQ